MLPNVKILIQNGAIGGLLSFAEGVAGMIGTGVSVTDKITLGTPVTVYNLQEAIALGIESGGTNDAAYRQVKEFYDMAGPGAELNIMLVADTQDQADMVDTSNANGAKKLLNYAQGRIRLLFTFFKPPGGYTLVATNGIDADVYAAMVNAQVLAKEYADANIPFRVILEGREFTGTASDLTDLTTLTNNRTAILIGGSLNDKTCSTGLATGAAAALPVQRKISRVLNGAMPLIAAYVGTTKVDDSTQLGAIHDKGFITIRKFGSNGGYFFSSDHMACKNTDDYRFLARGRVIDKAHVITYATYVEEIDNDVLTISGGRLDPGVIKSLEDKIRRALQINMVGNISDVRVSIDPEQNVTTTNKLKIKLALIGVAYLGDIEVELGFGL